MDAARAAKLQQEPSIAKYLPTRKESVMPRIQNHGFRFVLGALIDVLGAGLIAAHVAAYLAS